MSNEVFAQIRELKQRGNFVDAWNCGYAVFQNDLNNTYLRTALFWVCYAAIKATQESVLNRQNKAPNNNEQDVVNSWVSCIGQLNLPVPCEELDFRFFNLFKGCGEHYQTYIQMLTFFGANLYQPDDLKPYPTERGEYPSLVVRLARQTSKAWLQHHKEWQLDLDGILNLLQYALDNALDKNKTWLQFDISKCLVSANRFDEARNAALLVLRKKMSESWAWGALADTYVVEDTQAAIACYCKGIIEAHEPPFCIPMYFGLAKLFSGSNEFNLASASLSKLIEIYNEKGWALKPQHEELVQQTWFDASCINDLNFEAEIKSHSDKSLQYATGKLEMATGIVDSHHRSGKGFSIYIDLGNKLSARKGLFYGKGLPEVGTWLELKLANDGQQLEVMEAHKVESKQSERVKLIEGALKLNPKGFGFVDDAFIAPHLLNGFNDQEQVEAIKIWDENPKKGTPSWRVIKIVKSQSTVKKKAQFVEEAENERFKSIINKLDFEDFEGFILWWFPCNDSILNCLFSYWDSRFCDGSGIDFAKLDSRNEQYLSTPNSGIFCYGDDLYLNWSLSQNPNIQWSLELIDKYRDRWLWNDLSANDSLPWSVELIDKYQERWDWSVFSANNPLPWSSELIDKYRDRWLWNKLSANDSLPWSVELIDKYQERWDWSKLSANNPLPWSIELIDKYQERWGWSKLSANSSLPWSVELIDKYQERWDWLNLSANDSLPWSLELIDKYQERWDWSKLSDNSSLPWSVELIDKYQERWDWSELSANSSLPWSVELIDKYQERWDWSELSANGFLPWSVELIDKYEEKWCWCNFFLSQRKLTLEFFDKYNGNLTPSDWACISEYGNIELSITQVEIKQLDLYEGKWAWKHFDTENWPLELIVKYSDRLDLWSRCYNTGWTHELIEQLKDHIDWTFLCANKEVPWSLDLIDKNVDEITWIKFFHQIDACPYGGHIANLSMFGYSSGVKDYVLDSISYINSYPSKYLSNWCKNNFKRIENDIQSLIIDRFTYEQKKSNEEYKTD
jgi:hypothetical protein